MEIVELFNSSINELLRYRKSRVSAFIFLPLALLLCTASLSVGWPPTPMTWAANLFLACTLLLQFRLWDDLSDVAKDRLNYPQRVLCQATSLTPYRGILAALFTLNLMLIVLLKPAPMIATYLILNAGTSIWYWVADSFRIGPAVGYHFVLIKYPVFVLLLSPIATRPEVPSLIYAMGLVYLCFCVFEVLHDQQLHLSNGSIYLLAVEMLALELVATLMVINLRHVAGTLATIQGALVIVGAAVFVLLFLLHREHSPPGRWCNAVFLVGFTLLFNYSLATCPTRVDRTMPGPQSIAGLNHMQVVSRQLGLSWPAITGVYRLADGAFNSDPFAIEPTFHRGLSR